jgi:D-alanyl-D-alanine carboxypeptidase
VVEHGVAAARQLTPTLSGCVARAIGVLATAMLITACSGGGGDDRNESRAPSQPASTAPAAATTTPAVTAPPTFDGRVEGVPDATRLHASWRPGCPVALEELRLLSLDHWGYDGVEHRGELVVHADHADSIVGVFRALFDMRFPIERIELVDAYGGDDDAVMAANATSGFNCREVVGRSGVWSQHAYGLAIDVNPLTNPYVISPDDVRPPEGRAYLDRTVDAPGLIRAGDAVVHAFASIGWEWGGAWSMPDYQHFSATGN